MADGITLADLNEKHIKGCIRLGVEGGRIPASAISVPIEETLVKWKLLKNGVPTNGATMLFSDNIDEYPQFRLRMARFVGTDKMSLLTISVSRVAFSISLTQVWHFSSNILISAAR